MTIKTKPRAKVPAGSPTATHMAKNVTINMVTTIPTIILMATTTIKTMTTIITGMRGMTITMGIVMGTTIISPRISTAALPLARS